MKADHPLAKNLYERLSRFTPRQGEKRKREPLEDYLTEAIAFFLLFSEEFGKLFVTDVLKIDPPCALFTVATQSVDNNFDGRADLVLEIKSEPNLRVGIEVKRYAAFQDDQLKRLKDGFPSAAYLLAPESYIETHRHTAIATGVLTACLEDVHRISVVLAAAVAEPQRTLLMQFSEFLKSKGHARMVFHQTPMNISSVSDAARMMDEWSNFLTKIRSELDLARSGQWAVPRWDGPSERWPDTWFYGIYGPDNFYAGFRIGSNNTVDCYYEESRPSGDLGAALGEGLERGTDGRVYCHSAAPYPTSDVSKHAVEMIRIFRTLQTEVREVLSASKK